MFKNLQRHKVEIRCDEDGKWWFYADNADSSNAIQELIKQTKGESNV
jgi:hypothetical protein